MEVCLSFLGICIMHTLHFLDGVLIIFIILALKISYSHLKFCPILIT